MKEIRLARKIIRTLVKDRMQYPARLFADTATIVARCGVLLLLYAYVFSLNDGTIKGTTFAMVAWSMFFYFSFITLSSSRISRAIMQDITSGQIEVLLSKPITYLSYRAWWQIGAGVYPFIVTTILGAVTLAMTVGIPQTMKIPLFLPTLLVTFIGAIIVTLFIYTIVGLLSFWIEDVLPIFWIVDKAVMILGGSYLPVALFPDFMYKIALYSPFGASVFVTHTVYESWTTIWYKLISIQLFWIVVLGGIIYFMFSRAVKNVSVNGG
ncbi:MAG: ABC-2 family transporter protein [bacterium]|nr:ABC-2 family transporter protein [bacterium]